MPSERMTDAEVEDHRCGDGLASACYRIIDQLRDERDEARADDERTRASLADAERWNACPSCHEAPAAVVDLPGGCAAYPDERTTTLCPQHIHDIQPNNGMRILLWLDGAWAKHFGGDDMITQMRADLDEAWEWADNWHDLSLEYIQAADDAKNELATERTAHERTRASNAALLEWIPEWDDESGSCWAECGAHSWTRSGHAADCERPAAQDNPGAAILAELAALRAVRDAAAEYMDERYMQSSDLALRAALDATKETKPLCPECDGDGCDACDAAIMQAISEYAEAPFAAREVAP